MDFWQFLLLAAVCANLWAGRRNGTSWALALAYFAVQGWWLLNGRRPLEPGDLFMVDLVTIVLIFCKAVARDLEPCDYRDVWQHLRCFLLAPTPVDRIILASFPVLVWPAYVVTADPWWWLYGVSMLQLALAGGEGLSERRQAKAPEDEPDTPSSGLMFAWAGAERWST